MQQLTLLELQEKFPAQFGKLSENVIGELFKGRKFMLYDGMLTEYNPTFHTNPTFEFIAEKQYRVWYRDFGKLKSIDMSEADLLEKLGSNIPDELPTRLREMFVYKYDENVEPSRYVFQKKSLSNGSDVLYELDIITIELIIEKKTMMVKYNGL